MMAAWPQSTCDAMGLLPDVWNLLLDPSKKVIDDTCLEKLLSWMTELADLPASLKKLLDETSDTIRFLQKALHPDCNSATQVFAMRLSAVVLKSLNGCSAKTQLAHHLPEEDPVRLQDGEKRGFSRETDTLQCKYMYIGVIGDLVEEHLMGSYKSSGWQKASIRNAWFESARALISCKCPSDFIQRQGILDLTLHSLEDNCLFVISAAQQFLADLISAMYTCSNQQSTMDHTQECQEPQWKRCKVDAGDAKPTLKSNCDCPSFLNTCLQSLTSVMTAVQPVQARLDSNSSLVKQRTAVIGVWSRLLESQPCIAHATLTDISIVSIISELVQYRSHTSLDMCSSIVEFLSLFLKALHVSSTGSKLVAVMIGLPMKLMNIHQFKAAIQLASNLFSDLQSNMKGHIPQFQLSDEDSASLLSLVVLPVDCVLSLSESPATTSGSSSLLSDVQRCLLMDRMQSKCQCLTLVCHSLSALYRMIDRDLHHVICQHTSLVDQASDLLSLTLGQRSNQVVTDSVMRCHLQGSIKVTKAVLGLAMATLASESQNACISKLPDSSMMTLLLQLIAVLKNPESDPIVVSKCLDVLALLLPMYAVELNLKELMTSLAETVTKRMCDPQWAVRDSVIGFLQRLLRSPTGDMCRWFKCHKLHVRISECIDDGESFVRATAMSALVDISKQDVLWKDLLQMTGKSEIVLVGESINFLLDDSPGFLRRATVNAFTEWLKVFPWLETGLAGRLQGFREEESVRLPQGKDIILANGKTGEITEESMAAHVRRAVSTAMFDMDWEVKHGALLFWQTLLDRYTPRTNKTTAPEDVNKKEDPDHGIVQTSEGNVCEVNKRPDYQSAASVCEWLQFLSEEALIGKLVEVLEDEDPTVARRACQMLLEIYNCLPKDMTMNSIDDSNMVTFMEKMQGELERLNLKELLEEKTKLMHANGQNPLSLLQDILTGTEENDSKFLDCY